MSLWKEEVMKYGTERVSLYRVWMKFVWARTLAGLGMVTVYAVSNFLQSAVLVKLILSYLESSDDNVWYGLGLAASLLTCQITRACAFQAVAIYGPQTGTRFRSGVTGLLYNKLLKLKSVGGKGSEILNIFSVDSHRVYMGSYWVVYILSAPICIVIGVIYCYHLVGHCVFVAMAVYTALFILQVLLSQCFQKLRRRCVQHTDVRINIMNAILSSIKFIKLYSWENPFKDSVQAERKEEQKYLVCSGVLDAIAGSVIPVTPTIASMVTLAVYTALGNHLTASTAFAVIGTTNFMRIITAMIPYATRMVGEAKVSLERIQAILLMEEFCPPCSGCLCESNAIEVKEASFAWDCFNSNDEDQPLTGENTSALSHITLDIKKGHLVGLCGAVGSGKSALLSAILGRMKQLKGFLAVNGDVAYVGQYAWIFNGTVRDNILFGRPYNAERYKDVIRCCALETDLQRFDHGDKTEVGDHGVAISGGQKQRLCVARAAYSDSDIYLLDDPLSAVDTAVGKHVFHNCIRGFLRGKTILLVTNQLEHMESCDEMVVLEKGSIVERGHHSVLLNCNGPYSDIYQTSRNTTVKSCQRAERPTNNSDVKRSPTACTCDKNRVDKNKKSESVKRDAGKLTQPEETDASAVSVRTYQAYIAAAGGWTVAVGVVSVYVVAAGSLVLSDWLLSRWLDSGRLSNSRFQGNSTINDYTGCSIITDTKMSDTDCPVAARNSERFVLVYVLSLVGMLILQMIKGGIGAKVTIKASDTLHSKCLDSVLKASMVFFESNTSGRILNRFTKDLDEGDVYIPHNISMVLQNLCLVVLTFATTAYISPGTMIVICPVLVVFFYIKRETSAAVQQIKRLENVASGPLASHVNVTTLGLPYITAYGQQYRLYNRCIKYGDVASMMRFLFDISTRWIGIKLDLLAGSISVIAAVVFILTKGVVPASSAGLVLSLLGKTGNSLVYLTILMNELEARFSSIERIREYCTALDYEPQGGSEPPSEDWPTGGAIEFQDVSMRYRQDVDPVLRSVSFVIKPGEKIGVMGRTGAGKTSLAMCLFRLVELHEGTILIDGHDISKLSLHCLRSRIAVIPQDPVLFTGTLRYNVDPFSKYSDEDILKALEKIGIKQKILKSADQLDMILGEDGGNFSAGEKQLICLTRAVLRHNKILLLDEATSNVDTSTDATVQDIIRTCFPDCTIITIAHRPNTVLHCDKVIVMDGGRVVEVAPPRILLSDPNSQLRKMLDAQPQQR